MQAELFVLLHYFWVESHLLNIEVVQGFLTRSLSTLYHLNVAFLNVERDKFSYAIETVEVLTT
jgi:hypothetical protein